MRFFMLLLITGLLISPNYRISAQGVTTGSAEGIVTNTDSDYIIGAFVDMVHIPTGTKYTAITTNGGRFSFPNVAIGGPYKLKVSYIGLQSFEKEDIFISLNQNTSFKIKLPYEDEVVTELILEEETKSMNNNLQTGAQTYIDDNFIKMVPNLQRSQYSLTKLSPFADGKSYGGRNNLYNNYSLDGSIFNNSYGLDFATPGGQADAQPVSLDAIEQIQVSLAPFDVRQGGFSGAGINAVTKSGTNKTSANTYFYTRNNRLIGDRIGETKVENYDFTGKLFGVSAGGAIIKNKLFFFVNAEGERRDKLAHGFVADNPSNEGPNVTSVPEDMISAVQEHLRDEWNYEPGKYQNYKHETFNNKLLLKLNWNMNQKHQLSLRYNMLDARKDLLPHPEAIIGRGPTSYRLPFENSSYTIHNDIHSLVGELNSRLTDRISNRIIAGYSAFRDFREPHSEPFPVIDIFDESGNLAVTAGSEMFSTHNKLNQDVFQFTENLTINAHRHSFTAGINFEMFRFANSFNLFYYPWYMFSSYDEFLNADSDSHDFNGDVTESQKNKPAWSYVDFAQAGFYAQDKIHIGENLKLTIGLRVDIPMYLNDIEPDERIREFEAWEEYHAYDPDPSTWPGSNPMFSPRMGLNWDVLGNNSVKLRGGSGIFTGRIPFVWLGNQATNSRLTDGYTFQVNDTKDDFKFPQVWKNNLAADFGFSPGSLLSLEAVFAKDINAVWHKNYDMKKPTGKLSGADRRAVFSGFEETHIYSSQNPDLYLEAGNIVMQNTSEGYQYMLSAKYRHQFDFGLDIFAAYAFTESKDYTSIPAEIAADAFQRNPVTGDPNSPLLSYSRYGLKHRGISSVFYTVDYANFSSSFALVFEAAKGRRYSYTYAGDLNQDGIMNNDLLYVPADKTEINFGTSDEDGNILPAENADEQWEALDAFIKQDPYLNTRRGQYAERNGAVLPAFARIDFKFIQEMRLSFMQHEHRLQFSVDAINIGNLINPSWGVQSIVNKPSPLNVVGLDKNNTPFFNFNTDLKQSFIDDASINSKWQVQLGFRYIF